MLKTRAPSPLSLLSTSSTLSTLSTLVLMGAFARGGTAQAQDRAPGAAAPSKVTTPAPAGSAKPSTVSAAPPKGSAAPAGAGAAPVVQGPPMPEPPKELGAFMKGFEGGWRCDSRFAAGAMGPGVPEMNLRSIVRVRKEFGGFSWHGEYTLPKSKVMPALTGFFQIGYDSGSNQATIVAYDNMGTAAMGAGPMVGDTVTFLEDEYSMGMKLKLRETMTKRSPKEIYHRYEVDSGKGFQLLGEDTCKR